MALNNKNPATERLAHLLADATGESLAEAVTVARAPAGAGDHRRLRTRRGGSDARGSRVC